MGEKTLFEVNRTLCVGCGKCIKVCPGNIVGGVVLTMKDGYPEMNQPDQFGWFDCWKCQHCLAVCPKGAVSIFGVKPEDVPQKPSENIREELPKLISYRRACRHFKSRNVDKEIIHKIIEALECAPTGGNTENVEYTIVDDKAFMANIWETAFRNDIDYRRFEDFEANANVDALKLYNAPHLFIAHKVAEDKLRDEAISDVNIATAYFELLCNAFGLGTILTNYACTVVTKNDEVRKMLAIPENHYFSLIVGFGYPDVPYARGVKKSRKDKIHYVAED